MKATWNHGGRINPTQWGWEWKNKRTPTKIFQFQIPIKLGLISVLDYLQSYSHVSNILKY